MPSVAKWTFIVHMAGDNNLPNAGDHRSNTKMRKVGSTPDVNVLVRFYNAVNYGTQRFHALKSGHDLVEFLGETDSGYSNILLYFVIWMGVHSTKARLRGPLYRHFEWCHHTGAHTTPEDPAVSARIHHWKGSNRGLQHRRHPFFARAARHSAARSSKCSALDDFTNVFAQFTDTQTKGAQVQLLVEHAIEHQCPHEPPDRWVTDTRPSTHCSPIRSTIKLQARPDLPPNCFL